MSKSSANPRKYSKGRDALDMTEPLVVYLEIRLAPDDVTSLDAHLKYLVSRRPAAVIDVVGIRRESSVVIATLGIDMGEMRAALRGTTARMQDGYHLLWDIWDQMVERTPVFSAPPGGAEMAMARRLGFGASDEPAGAPA